MPFQFESTGTGTASCIFRLVVERVYVLPSKTKINKSFIYLKNIFSSFYSLDTIIPSIRHIYIYFKISENRSLNYFSLENNSLTNLTHSHRVSSSRFRPVNVKRSILTAYMGKSPSPYVSRRPRYIYIYIYSRKRRTANKSADEIGWLTRSFRVSRASDRERGKNLWRIVGNETISFLVECRLERRERPTSVFNKT